MSDAERHTDRDDAVHEARTGPDDAADAPEPATADGPAPDASADERIGGEQLEGEQPGGDEVIDEGLTDLVAAAEADPRSRAELLGELLAAEEKRDEYLDDLRRAHADFENYRKRVMREGAMQHDAGRAAVLQALLDVLDDLDRTRDAAEGSDDATLAKGVELVATKLGQVLGGLGLERIDAADVEFDPTVHEAVSHLPSDEEDATPIVAEVLRPGYRLGERTLRPAMVVVRG